MDDQVIAAMARWPNVPAVYGWLSLTARGEWRLHPDGGALDKPDAPGAAITSPPILQFIGRNYAGDEQGRWYFQNGPQRVYVRLDAAPYILHTTRAPAQGGGLHTHNGLAVDAVSGWWLDSEGHLYARTEHGPALVSGRDLEAVLTMLQEQGGPDPGGPIPGGPIPGGPDLMDMLMRESGDDDAIALRPNGTLLTFCRPEAIPVLLGFVRRPGPPAGEPDAAMPVQGA